jgi:hypothetical protein
MHYSVRNKCIFCDTTDFDILFETDYQSSLSLALLKSPELHGYMPYNILICKNCNTAQNKYLADLNIVYGINHQDNYGITKNLKHEQFKDFILENKNIIGIIEVGSCHNVLSKSILEKIETEYTVIEPSFTGYKDNINIISDYIENVDLQKIHANTIIMSDIFEHFYNPKDILNKLNTSSNIEYIYLNHPDFDYSIKNNIHINLNCEHTFLIEHQFLFKIFEQYGFALNRRIDYKNFSLFLEFKRISYTKNENNNIILKNISTNIDVKKYFNNIINKVKYINDFIENNSNGIFYIWPSSLHSIPLFTMGLNYKKLNGVLDNSPNKIGKYLHTYNLLCSSFDEIVKSENSNIYIIMGGAGNYCNEIDYKNSKVNII